MWEVVIEDSVNPLLMVQSVPPWSRAFLPLPVFVHVRTCMCVHTYQLMCYHIVHMENCYIL